MKVSDSRKIHIIALPQGTPLKVLISEDQSLAVLVKILSCVDNVVSVMRCNCSP